MKKLLACLLALCLLPCLAFADTAPFDTVALPDGIEAAFAGSEWNGYGPIAVATTLENDAACVVMRSVNRNILCLLKKVDGAWRLTQKSAAALYQGKRCPLIFFQSRNAFSIVYGASAYDTASDDYEEYSFESDSAGVYRFLEYTCAYSTDRAEDFQCYAQKGGLEYHVYARSGDSENATFVSGVIELALPYFNIALFPKSIEEARRKLSSPDALPKSSELTIQSVTLTPGKKFPVYSAPYADSIRAANCKAAVSTNDWVSVFGQDGNWLLIEYDISSDQSRFGYITTAALPKNTNVDELLFSYRDARVTDTCAITDDPLRSRNRLWTIYAGEYVTYLADFGDGWAYVEYESGATLLRGFIRQEILDIL